MRLSNLVGSEVERGLSQDGGDRQDARGAYGVGRLEMFGGIEISRTVTF